MSNIFSHTEVLTLPRSYQKMNWNLMTSIGYGKIYPVFAMHCVPGDTLRILGSMNIRAKQMVAPNLTPNKATVHFFFVPYRLLDENFTQGVTGTTEKGEAVTYEFPKWTKTASSTKLKTLWDYFGLPINVKVNASGLLEEDKTNVKGVEPTRYLKRAYNLVFNTMYRNENFVDEVSLDSEDLQYRCWRADYFTKALPWQQKPSESNYFALPVNSNILPVTGNPDLFFNTDVVHENGTLLDSFKTNSLREDFKTANDYFTNTETFAFTPKYAYKVQMGDNVDSVGLMTKTTKNVQGQDYNSFYKKYAGVDGTPKTAYQNNGYIKTHFNSVDIANVLDVSSTSFDVSDLRLALQMQKWAERNARGGTRYDEMIKAHFGITPRDARLQLPEFLGGFKFPILCGENYSTVETESNPQGTRAGIANGIGADKIRKYFVEEYGLVLGLISVLPQAEYQQGINRQWILHDQLDFYHHELCCLSEREIYQGELVCSNSDNDTVAEKHNTTNFGFTGIYNEYRFHPNIITGEMRVGQYAQWHQSRVFDAGYDSVNDHPNTVLNQNFVEARNVQLRPFADLNNQDPFIVTGHFTVKAFRPMTYRSEPGLIDHF